MNGSHEPANLLLHKAYGLRNCKLLQIKGGVTNVTYHALRPDGRQYILQNLNPIFTQDTIADYDAVSRELTDRGWDLQQLIPTVGGEKYAIDKQGLWRLLTYLPSDTPVPHLSISIMRNVGALLANMHKSLAQCDYLPKYMIPHCHDTAYIMRSLDDNVSRLATRQQALAKKVIDSYHTLEVLPTAPKQLIHGDPRTTNILYKNGMPYTYIDFDMMMISTPWVDIGDLLRAISGDASQTEARFNQTYVDAVISGYTSSLDGVLPKENFHALAMNAMKMISLELSARFLIDIVHDEHFGWDNSQFASRKDHNFARAQAQYTIYSNAAILGG